MTIIFLDEKMNFKEKLKEWNDGMERGAPARLAREIGAVPSAVTPWLKGVVPSEVLRPKIAKAFGITVNDLLALFSEEEAESTGSAVARGMRVVRVPVVGVVGADTFAFNFDDPPLEPVTVLVEGSASKRYGAFRVRGDCMEPRFHDGEVVVVAESSTVPDGVPGVFRLDAHCTLKIPRRHADGIELCPLNPKFQSKTYRTNKLTVVGVVVSVTRKP